MTVPTAQGVSAYREALASISTQPFQAGKYFSSRHDDFNLVVIPLAGPKDRRPHLIVLAHGIPPGPDVQGLPFGIIDDARVITVGITNHQGHCVVELPPGSFRVWFVTEVTQSIDAEIILLIDDESFIPLVEDVLEDPNTPETLQQEINTLRQSLIAAKLSKVKRRERETPVAVDSPGIERAEGSSTIWDAEVEAALSADEDVYPVGARLKWQSPKKTLVAVLERPLQKSATGRTPLTMIFYDGDSGEWAGDVQPRDVLLCGVSAESIEPGRAHFVWEDVARKELPDEEASLVLDEQEWTLIDVTAVMPVKKTRGMQRPM